MRGSEENVSKGEADLEKKTLGERIG